VVTGRLREDARPDEKQSALEDALKVFGSYRGFRVGFCLETPQGQEGVLMVTIWDSEDDAFAAANAAKTRLGLEGFSVLLDEPPRNRLYPVAAFLGF
jgi:hypothetical protein